MAGESVAILAVIVAMDIMFLRAGKKGAVLLSFPLMTVPAFYLLGNGVATFIPISAEVLHPGMVVAGALTGILGCGILLLFIKNKAGRTAYFSVGTIYLVALAIAYLMRLY